MTTTDTDALIERIARAAATSEGFDPDQPDHEVVVGEYLSDARFLAPFIDVEVRKAKAEALREAADSVHDNAASPYCLPCHRDDADLLHTIATEYESGDSDEHR